MVTQEWDFKADFKRFANRSKELMFSGSGKLKSILRMPIFSSVRNATMDQPQPMEVTCPDEQPNNSMKAIDARAQTVAQCDAHARPASTALTDARAQTVAQCDAHARDDATTNTSATTALADASAQTVAQCDAYAREDVSAHPPTDARAQTEAQCDAYARNGVSSIPTALNGYAMVDATEALQNAVDDVDPGLRPPMLNSAPNMAVTGAQTKLLRKQNKQFRKERLRLQSFDDVWKRQQGQFRIPTPKQGPARYVGSMCPTNLALEHPAAATLLEYASGGCPTKTGKNWSREMIEEAVHRGPHVSATTPEAIEYFKSEIKQKVETGQARIVEWDDIKDNPPPELKLSPLALVPHKSRKFRAIEFGSGMCWLAAELAGIGGNLSRSRAQTRGSLE